MNDDLILTFTGDIGFDKYMDGKWDDNHLIDEQILHFLHDSDHVIPNVEGALVEPARRDPSGTAQLIHSMNPKAVEVLERMHADVWNLCNNHIMDAGEEGIRQTLQEARRHHALTVGAGMDIEEAAKPIIFSEAGGVGIFSAGYRRGCKPADNHKAGCLLWNDMDRIQKNINEIKQNCRWCILIVHGGEEFTSLPSPYVRDRYLKFLNMGVDIIVGHHPHVPMNYETVGKKIIFYSLGNFIFDTDYQRAQSDTDKGIILKLHLNPFDYQWQAMGLNINRNNEHIEKADLPLIFENVDYVQYDLLEPLAARQMIEAYKRRDIYLNPSEWKNASEEKWRENFMNPKRSGRVEGEALDFQIILPLANREKEKNWQKSRLEGVKKYILDQIKDAA